MTAALFVLADGIALVAGVLTLRAGEHERWRQQLQAFAVEFPYGTKPEAVTNILEGLAGLAAPWWRQVVSVRGVVFETVATPAGINHRLLVSTGQADIVLSALRAHLPGARVTALDAVPAVPVTFGAQFGLSGDERPLATKAAGAVSGGLLASLQPLTSGEAIVVQIVVQPGAPVSAVTPVTTTSRDLWRRLLTAPPETVDVAAQRAKHAHSAFLVTPRVGVTAPSLGARKALLGRVLASFHAANAPGVHLFRRHLPQFVVTRNVMGRFLSLLVAPCPLNAAELGMLVGIPLGDVALPGLRLGTSRLLAPSSDIARVGRVVALSTFPGSERPLALSVPDSLRHLHAIGPTGVGKSTLLLGLITQDMQAGRGVVVIDPKGDLAADVIDRVPRTASKT